MLASSWVCWASKLIFFAGYSREECLGRNCKFLQGKDTDQHAVQAIRKAISNQQEFRYTIRNYRKDGRPFWNDLHLCPVFDSFGTMCMIVGAQLEVDVPGLEQVTFSLSLHQDICFLTFQYFTFPPYSLDYDLAGAPAWSTSSRSRYQAGLRLRPPIPNLRSHCCHRTVQLFRRYL